MSKSIITSVLALATCTGAFAQSEATQESYRIVVSRNDNGKTVTLDSTFTSEKAFNDFAKNNHLMIRKGDELVQLGDSIKMKVRDIRLNKDIPEPDNSELKASLEKLKEELKQLNIDLELEDNLSAAFSLSKDFKSLNDTLQLMKIQIDDMDSLFDKIKVIAWEPDAFSAIADINADDSGRTIVIQKKTTNKANEGINADSNNSSNADANAKTSPSNPSDDYKLNLLDFKLTPNPSQGKFNLTFRSESTSPVQISVYDFNGSEVYADKINNFSGSYNGIINMENKSKGNYVLKIRQDNRWVSHKLVLN